MDEREKLRYSVLHCREETLSPYHGRLIKDKRVNTYPTAEGLTTITCIVAGDNLTSFNQHQVKETLLP